MTNVAMRLLLPKGVKLLNLNAKNPELNKVIPPLKKVRSCEEQLTEVREKYHDKYVNSFYPIIVFQKVYVSLLVTQYWLE